MPFLSSKSASGVMGFLTKGPGSKLITYVVVVWILTAAVNFLGSFLPAMLPEDLFGQLPSYFAYFVNLFLIPAWLSTRISVYVTRWAIRRIPIIGGR